MYLAQRHVFLLNRNSFLLINLVQILSQDVCLGKGSGKTFTTLRYSFYLFSAGN